LIEGLILAADEAGAAVTLLLLDIDRFKARIRCEFGTKASLATTLDGGFVVGARSFPGTPHDGHALAPALEQVVILTDQVPALAVVDRGYRGHGVETTRVLISGTRRGMTPLLAKLLKRRRPSSRRSGT